MCQYIPMRVIFLNIGELEWYSLDEWFLLNNEFREFLQMHALGAPIGNAHLKGACIIEKSVHIIRAYANALVTLCAHSTIWASLPVL